MDIKGPLVDGEALDTVEKRIAAVARDMLIDLVRRHEGREHQGEICRGSRLSAVAFIAHSLGVQSFDTADWETLHTLLEEYESTHQRRAAGMH